MKVALVYDRVNKWGGAERVMLALHDLFPDAPLYTSVYNSKTAGWADEFTVKPSFLQGFPLAKNMHEIYPLLMPIAFESFTFDEYDLVISVTSEAAKGILTKPSTAHLCYCLTPTRYLWSGYEEYFDSELSREFSYPAIAYLRQWDRMASSRPDHLIAISEEVRRRIQHYYGRDSQVIYPPVSLFSGEAVRKKEESYFLVVSRLVSYKRIDLAIEACNTLQLPLKIIGIGGELQRLQKLAGPTIEFLGSVPDDKLRAYYRGAKALLFPGFEDFGITMAEAAGFGVPVIAYKAGGAVEIIKDGETGLLFSPQTKEALVTALKKFQTISFNTKILRDQAEHFSQERFQKQFLEALAHLFPKLPF